MSALLGLLALLALLALLRHSIFIVH